MRRHLTAARVSECSSDQWVADCAGLCQESSVVELSYMAWIEKWRASCWQIDSPRGTFWAKRSNCRASLGGCRSPNDSHGRAVQSLKFGHASSL
jgi:hypothetical protein